MKLEHLIYNLQGAQLKGEDVDVKGISYDSRKVAKGDIFAAVKGGRFDGHEFIEDAVKSGATAILCAKPPKKLEVPAVVVDDVRGALAVLARRLYRNPASLLTTIGVTGTNGKTTVVRLVAAILEAAGMATGTFGTLGARYGDKDIPLNLTTPEAPDLMRMVAEMHESGARALAMEVSSHALAQRRVDGMEFDIGVFTNLTHDHLDFHGDFANYFEAKTRLFTHLLKNSGRAVINLDDEWVRNLRIPGTVAYSMAGAKDAEIALENLRLAADGSRLDVRVGDESLRLRTSLLGRFHVENVLAAVGVAHALGIGAADIARGIEGVKNVPGRLERIETDGGPLFLVDYAHSPDALKKAIAAARELTTERVLCVFGCGGERDKDKRLAMGEIAGEAADVVVVTNDNPRGEDPQVIAKAITGGLKKSGMRAFGSEDRGFAVELDRREAIRFALKEASKGDIVLVCGKGHEAEQEIAGNKIEFDDRQVASELLEEFYGKAS